MLGRRAALAVALLVPLPAVAFAQGGVAGGPYMPVISFLPANPRILAMGNTGVASSDDPLFFNPAELVTARGMAVSAERYSPSSGGGSISSVTSFHGGGVGVGMRLVDYEAPLAAFPSDRSTLLDGGPGAGTSVEAVVGIGQAIKGVRVGGAAKYIEDHTPAQRSGRAAFDIGVSKNLWRNYTFGLAVQNIGGSTRVACAIATQARGDDCVATGGTFPPGATTSARLPLRTTLGVATGRAVGPLDVAATAAVSLLQTNFVIPSGGAEASYSWLDGYAVAVRAGGRRPVPGESGFTAGAGFTADRVSIDYALETLGHSRTGHRIGLRIR